ncbi:MAG: hypothetical protein GQ558_03965 [Thermoplasmata archaeon]|nr:hypothetical protein [Thermoplasmata archaeon]
MENVQMGYLNRFTPEFGNRAFQFVVSCTALAVLTLILTGMASADGSWTEERGGSNNSGFVPGVGLITEIVEKYQVVDDDILESTPISADLDKNGINEIIFTTLNGTVSIFDGEDGSLVKSIVIGGRIRCPPLVYDLSEDGILDIIVFRSSADMTTMISINSSDFSQTVLRAFSGETYAPAKIMDIDMDGNDEVLIQTYTGNAISFDLSSLEIDWIQFIHEGLSESPALFRVDDDVVIAITTGITYKGVDIFGSPILYFIEGTNGRFEWNYTPGDVRIDTPPTVIKISPTKIYIAVGDGLGNVFIVDYLTRQLYHSILKSGLREYPYWHYINWYFDGRNNRTTVLLLGENAIIAVDLFEKRIIWQHWPFYLDTKVDSLFCDIDADTFVELVVLQSNNMHKRNNLMILNATNGDVKLNISGLPHHPRGITLADFDGDGAIEISVRCMNNLIVFDSSSMIKYLDLLFDGEVIEDGTKFQLYSGYKAYEVNIPAILSAPITYVKELRIIFDPSDQAIEVSYSPNDTSYSVSDPQLIAVEAMTTTRGASAWTFSVYFVVNWSFPHENPFHLNVSISYSDGYTNSIEKRDVFRVENDVEFTGKLTLMQSGKLFRPNDWFTTKDIIEGTGLKTVYQGTLDKYVDMVHFSLAISTGGENVDVHVLDDNELSFELEISDYLTGRHEMELVSTRSPQGTDPPHHSFGIWVDAEPPMTVRVYPSGDNWLSSRNITVGIVASDMNGSGINHSTVSLRIAPSQVFNDSEEWIAWDETLALNDTSIEFRRIVNLESGLYSFQWRLADIAGNDLSYSPVQSFGIDLVSVEFFDFDPVGWNLNRTVGCGITVQVASEVTLLHSTVQYSYSNDVNGPWDWLEPGITIVDNRTVRLGITVECVEGTHNYLQWRVYVNESVSYYSEMYTVLIDSASPVFGDPSPDISVLLDTGDVEISLPISDPTSGLNLSSIAYQFSEEENFTTSKWISVIIDTPNHEVTAKVQFRGLVGKSNYLRLRAMDMAGNPFSFSPTFNIRINELPQVQSIIPGNGSHFEINEAVHFRINLTDPDPTDTLIVEWRSDVDGVLGSNISFTTTDLTQGGHNITVLVDDGHGNPLIIAINVVIDPKPQPGTSEDEPSYFIPVLIIVAILVVVIVLLIIRQRAN